MCIRDSLYRVFFFTIDHAGGSQLEGFVQTFLHDVNYVYVGHAQRLQRHHGYQTDTARSGDYGYLSHMGSALLCCMETYSQKMCIRDRFIGILVVGILTNGLDLMNVSSYYQQIIKGAIILLAVLADRKKE